MARGFVMVLDGIVEREYFERASRDVVITRRIGRSIPVDWEVDEGTLDVVHFPSRGAFQPSRDYLSKPQATHVGIYMDKNATWEENLPYLLWQIGVILRATTANCVTRYEDEEYTLVRLNGRIWMNPDSLVLKHVDPGWLGVEVSFETHDLPHGRWEHP